MSDVHRDGHPNSAKFANTALSQPIERAVGMLDSAQLAKWIRGRLNERYRYCSSKYLPRLQRGLAKIFQDIGEAAYAE